MLAHTDSSCQVEQLADVFENDFHFETRKEVLAAGKNPQLELNAKLSNFILEFDDEHTLCIIYYAGHGWEQRGGENGSEFRMAG